MLINGYFADPINQRGQAEYEKNTTARTYAIDRWSINNDAGVVRVILENGYLTLNRLNAGIIIFGEVIENLNFFLGKTVTFSILKSNGLVTVTYTFPSEVPVSIDSPEGSSNNLLIDFYASSSMINSNLFMCRLMVPSSITSVNLIAAKLELGDRQTLAHQDSDGNWVLNDPPPDKALELTKCQRYFQIIGGGTRYPAILIMPDFIDFLIPLNTYMPSIPTITGILEVMAINSQNSLYDGFTYSVYKSGVGVRVRAAKANHGLSNATLLFKSTTTGFDAEIY